MTIKIIGFAQSSYVWTARAALTTKGLEHEFVALAPPAHKGPEYLKKHPFGKVPALEVDGEALFETTAIMRWADAKGTGPSLFSGDALAAAKVEQWVSAINAYYYQPIVADYVLKYVFAPEGGPDRATIDAALPVLRERLGILSRAIQGSWIVGEQISAADLLVGPLLFGLSRFPEGKEILGENAGLGRLMGALSDTPSFMAGAASA